MANHIVITGNICNDLEIKTNGETRILSFVVAVRRKFKDKEGNYQTDFIRCVAFNSHADFLTKYFAKGNSILIEGSLQTNSYETEAGEKRNTFNVVVEGIDFMGSKNNNNQSQNNSFEQTMQQNGVEFTTTDSDDSLPF